MTKTPAFRKLLAGILLLLGSVTQASAQTPPPGAMLDPKLGPKFEDVHLTVPTAEELKSCTVKLVNGAVPKSNGWLLSDAKGQPLRKYFDANGDGKVDMWSYYKDGVEVYREIDTTGAGFPDNFRWLNAGGTKWGIGGFDKNAKEWRITAWRMISAEEVALEAFQAVAKNDYARLETLFITNADMQAIKLPAGKTKAIAAHHQQAPAKFQALVKTLNLGAAKADVVETATPQCDTTNGDIEIIKFASRAVRYPAAGNKYAWIHTGEMIQVGLAWRLVEVPLDKDPTGEPRDVIAGGGNKQLEKLQGELADHDKTGAPYAQINAKNKEVDAYYRKRIELVKQIILLDKDENWRKQLFDNLTAQAQNSCDPASIAVLKQLRDEAIAEKPGSNLAAYGTYREMWTRYAVSTAVSMVPKEIAEAQDKWLDDLDSFVTKYPSAEDTKEAHQQLATGCEFAGKTEQAKRRYKEFADAYPNHPATPRMTGSLARLNLVGKKLELSAPLLSNPGTAFEMGQLKGKVVIVHYWSTASSTHAADFAVLKQIMGQVNSKNDVELVCISLDDDAAKAKEAVAKAQVPGVHLFHATNMGTGLNSPPAIQYGIHILPTMFMVGRDGVVTNNALQMSDVVTELKKIQ